jgi:hypothetical protein
MGETLHGILKLLESAEILLEIVDNEAMGVGLCTYEVEEYGKLLVMKQNAPLNGKLR